MSSTRIKINRTLRNRQGDLWATGHDTKIAMFACFYIFKKPLFSLFLQILEFPAKIQKNNKIPLLVSTNPIFCTQSSKLMKEEYPKEQHPFLLVIKPNGIKLRPCVPLCGWIFCQKDFIKSVHPFQRYCLKTAIAAHHPTL